ncbi:MAG: hypothetical protein M0Z71_15845, partial [Nitrospiraceae bacterium]|nr:hypothetical protein [Nitrospiraceae bacterium]
STLQLETDVLLDVVEPYLLKTGFIIRTSHGRKASEKAYVHLKEEFKEPDSAGLFGSIKHRR